MATYNDDNILIPNDVFKIINININSANGLCEPGAPTVTGDDGMTQCHSLGFNEAYIRCNRTPGCLGIYHDSKGFQPVSWGGPGCKTPNDDLNLSSRPMPFQLAGLPVQPGNGILYVLMEPYNRYSSCSINEIDGFYTNGTNKVLSYVPNRFSTSCYYCQDGSNPVVSGGCNNIKCSSGNPAMFNQKDIISVDKEINSNLAYRGTDINSHFASSNTQIILDNRLPILDNNGNADFDKRLGNNPVIGTIINGPFVQPGTTVTAIENTNNSQIITLSQPLVNVLEKNNQIFIYTFNDSTPPPAPKRPTAPTPPSKPTPPTSPTSPTPPTVPIPTNTTTQYDDSTNVDKNNLEQSNLFTPQNIIIGIVLIFVIIIIIVLLSK